MRFSYLLFLLFLISCSAVYKLDIQGHRGARGLLPENTIPAFEEAIRLGVNTIELDVVISKDHQVVVSHEPYINHEMSLDVNGNLIADVDEEDYNIYQMTYDSIRLYDVGTKVHPRFPNQKKLKVFKPLLSDVFQMAEKSSHNKIKYNIEIKSQEKYDHVFTPDVDEFVKLVLNVINHYNLSKRVTLQSFDLRALEAIHRQQPKIKTALLVDLDESIHKKLSALTFKPDIISPDFGLLDSTVVDEYHRLNFKIIPWTVNTEDDIKQMIHYKVDGIISDYPDLVIQLFKSTF